LVRSALIVVLLAANAANAAPLEVQVVLDEGLGVRPPYKNGEPKPPLELPHEVRTELEAFEAALRAAEPEVGFFVRSACGRESSSAGFTDVGIADLFAQDLARGGNACARSLRLPKWSEGSRRRILFIGPAGKVLSSQYTDIESVMHGYERGDVVVHTAEIMRPVDMAARNDAGLGELADDLERFLERPSEPLGRVSKTARHAALINGGAYHLAMLEPESRYARLRVPAFMGRVLARDRCRAALARAYGPGTRDGSDALTAIVEGRKRPNETSPEELPVALRDINLEPLLDTAWDFVDARRAAREALDSMAGPKPGVFGARMAEHLRKPRRWMPSRR